MESPEGCDTISSIGSSRLGREYYNIDCNQLAKALLGQILVRRENGNILKGRIVETEAYIGGKDLSSHTHHGKMTKRTAPAFMVPGTMYVYRVWYGMYHLFNISSKEMATVVMGLHLSLSNKKTARWFLSMPFYLYFLVCLRTISDAIDELIGEGACVLVRSLEPMFGIEEMKKKRSFYGKNPKKQLKSYKLNELCNGPSKLAIAMNIDTHFSGDDLVTSPEIWIESGPVLTEHEHIVECSRIGIESTDSFWASKPFRYYLLGNNCVSKRDQKAEEGKKIVHIN